MSEEIHDTAGLPLPPPALMTIFIVASLLLDWRLALPLPFPAWMKVLGWVFVLGGFGIAVSAVQAMIKSNTSPDPRTPVRALVTAGPYQWSRNPIYLGFLIIVMGLPLILGSYWGVLLSPLMLLTFNQVIIRREEAYLQRLFGQSYQDYRSQVRRWL